MARSTEASVGQAAALKSVALETETPPLVQAAGERSVRAVIGDRTGQGNFIVHCYPPVGAHFDVRLPEVLIPQDLRQYGRPVSIALDVQNGIRRPVISAREITEPLPKAPEQQEIERWLDSPEC